MTGIVGGAVTPDALKSMVSSLFHEPWYRSETRTLAENGVALVDHGSKDRHSNELWVGDDYLGALYGVISNLNRLPWTIEEIFVRVAERPDAVLPKLEGPFVLVAIDTTEATVRLATDKAGSRPCYYTANDGIYFASELSPLLEFTGEVTIDHQAISDLLFLGSVIGERTLIEGISNIPPATCITYSEGVIQKDRYWYPTFDDRNSSYVTEWIYNYQRAVDELAETIDGDIGLWLSGGIDSRVAAGAMRRSGYDFDTLTFRTDEGRDQRVAATVAERLGVDNRSIQPIANSDVFIEGIEKCVSCVDAMQSWGYVPNITFITHHLRSCADVVMEGGTFLGEDVWAYYIRNEINPIETLCDKRAKLSPDHVTSLLTVSVDPKDSLRQELQHCPQDHPGNQSVDAVRRLYSYLHMRSNTFQRMQAGTRVVSDGPFLNHVLNMPVEYRMKSWPITRGKIPHGIPKIKLDVMREMGMGLDNIPYERTMVRPNQPYWLHTVGFASKELWNILGITSSFQNIRMYREDETVRRYINGLVDDATERSFFEADELRDFQRSVLEGESDHLVPLASIVGLELWLQENIDTRTVSVTSRRQPERI